MSRCGSIGLWALPLLVCVGCAAKEEFAKHSLATGPNPFGQDSPLWTSQPHRDNPLSVVLTRDGGKLYVALQGDVDNPGNEIAVVDTGAEEVLRRIEVGSSPTSMALHPAGRFLAVTNRFSNYVSIIDTISDKVVSEIQVPSYTIDIVFHPNGERAFLSNRWKDSVLTWELDVSEGSQSPRFRVTEDNYSDTPEDLAMGIPVGQNPRDLALSPDGGRLYVGGLTGLTLSIIDTSTDTELDRIELLSPPGDVAATDDLVIITHTGRGTHHPPDEGYDTNGSGSPGDDTANVLFQDLQNEIAVLDHSGQWINNYTSDTICCFDYRDVDPDDPTRGERLPVSDGWPASRVDFLPPKESWTIACALPQQMAISGQQLLVVCSGSNEVQSFGIQDNQLVAQAAGELYKTGMNPYGIAIHPDNTKAYVAERLGEHITVLDLVAGPGNERRIVVGDISAGEYPATDAEMGEAINFVTAGFTIDGDQTCAHCHREGGNLAKPVAMPLQADTVWGTRMQMAYRGAFDTRPWFIESSMDETNFFPVINEFARRENFCCEQTDPLVWASYPTAASCVANDSQPGCEHVLQCTDNPPPECAQRGYGGTFPSRNVHFREAAKRLFGHDRTLGDALYQEIIDDMGNVVREGIALDFSGVTRAIGLFLIQQPRLLPNPYARLNLPAARRGRVLYESTATGCATCHPLPTTSLSVQDNPFSLPLRFAPVITPRLNPNTMQEVDSVNPLFVGSFPDTVQDSAGLHIGVPQLRGIWDRANMFLHDGRAKNLRETLATPGHPALAPGETGFNETYGMPDTHGATSHLSANELEDLISFLQTL